MQAWDRVTAARQKDRPTSVDFIQAIFEDFFELHGDRRFGGRCGRRRGSRPAGGTARHGDRH